MNPQQTAKLEELQKACFDVSSAVMATHLAEIVHKYVPENKRQELLERIGKTVVGLKNPASYCFEVQSGNDVLEIFLSWAYVDNHIEDKDGTLFHGTDEIAKRVRSVHAMYKDFLSKYWEYLQKTNSELIADIEKFVKLQLAFTNDGFRHARLAGTPRQIRFMIVARDKK